MAYRARWLGWGALLLLFCPYSRGLASARKPWIRRPGVLLYHLKEDASNDQKFAAARIIATGHPLSARALQAPKSFQSIALAAAGSEEEMAESLRASGAVDFAEPDYLMPAAAAVPDDPQYSSQWHHQIINSPGAWSYSTGNTSILVAVLDTGVDAAHPDLASNLSLPGFNVVDQSTNTDPVASHGTEVAGVLGAVGNNNLGVAGMDWAVKILPVRITDNPDTTAWCSDMGNGIEWAADHGAKVINLSYDTTGCPGTIEAASQYARSRGALVVVAAGNSAMDLSGQFPSSNSFVLVGATDFSDQRAIFSNYGAPVLLGAPGSTILTTQPGGYGTDSGTSFSAPLVAGVAALIYSLNPSWTPAVVENLILATAKSLGAISMGYGRIDAGAALAAAQNCLAGNCAVPGSPGANPQPATVTASDMAAVRAFPNPWRSDKHVAIPMTIDNLAAASEVKIFTVSGRSVRRLSADATGAAAWDLNNDSGDHVASGIYLYLVKNSSGQTSHGKLVVIR